MIACEECGEPIGPQTDRQIAEMIARFRTPPSMSWVDLANDIETVLKMKTAEIERLRAALRIFVGSSYEVSKKINPRGYDWRSNDALDYALSEAKKALAPEQKMPQYTGSEKG